MLSMVVMFWAEERQNIARSIEVITMGGIRMELDVGTHCLTRV